MKAIAAFAILIVGISAYPKLHISEADLKNERLVEGIVVGVINDVSQSIQDAGLDPLYINAVETYSLPVPVIFSAEAIVEELWFKGISNIVVNNVSYGLITGRLTFDIELPLIELSVNRAFGGVLLFGSDFSASVGGRVDITRVRVRGEARVSVGIITGISVRNLSINFTLGGIQSAFNVVIQNTDISSQVNNFLGVTIPATLDAYAAELNELFRIIAMDLIDELL